MTENSYKSIRRRFLGTEAYSVSFSQCDLIQKATDEEATRFERNRIIKEIEEWVREWGVENLKPITYQSLTSKLNSLKQ